MQEDHFGSYVLVEGVKIVTIRDDGGFRTFVLNVGVWNSSNLSTKSASVAAGSMEASTFRLNSAILACMSVCSYSSGVSARYVETYYVLPFGLSISEHMTGPTLITGPSHCPKTSLSSGNQTAKL